MAVAESSVQVHQVDPFGARLLPAQGGLDGVPESLLRAVNALHELDGLTALDVDGRQEFEVGAHDA